MASQEHIANILQYVNRPGGRLRPQGIVLLSPNSFVTPFRRKTQISLTP
jgi:hypothetical protein